MTADVEQLRNRRLAVWQEAKNLAGQAWKEHRVFTEYEQSRWDELNADLDSLDQRIKTVLDITARMQRPSMQRVCSYCRSALDASRENCRNCGAPHG